MPTGYLSHDEDDEGSDGDDEGEQDDDHAGHDENVDAPFSERVCLYYNYMKQNRIYRLLGKEISF